MTGHGIAGHTGYRFGDLTQRKAAARRAGNLDPAVAHFEIGHAYLQQVGCDLERLLPHLHGGEMHRGTRGRGLPAGEAALAMGNDSGIAGNHADVARRDAELLGADLREGGLDALAHRHRAGVDGNATGSPDAHDAGFEWAAARALDAVADADPEIAAAPPRAPLALGKSGIVDRLERGALVARKVAAIERDRRAGARLERKHIGHLFRRHEIAAADFGAVEVKLVGNAVEQPFHGEGAFRIARAAHRHGGDLVGLGDAHVEGKGRQHVGPG